MKKWLKLIGMITLLMSLAACGVTEAQGNVERNVKGIEDKMTAEKIFANSIEATEQLSSLHANITTNQLLTTAQNQLEMEMTTNSSMDISNNPLAFHQKTETLTVSEENRHETSVPLEMYFTNEGSYINETSTNSWLKLSDKSLEQLKNLADKQTADPSLQLQALVPFIEDVTLNQVDSEYILTLDASGEDFQELIYQNMANVLPQSGVEAPLENMKVHSVYYEIFIDKKTFLTNEMNVEMDMEIKDEQESLNILTDIQAEYSQFNEIKKIEVPKQIIDDAQSSSY